MKFNINDKVKIRLTDYGRECLLENAKEVKEYFPDYEHLQKVEDIDGWSEWQLWHVMQEFGKHIYLGGEVPFETTIMIGDDNET